MKTDLSDIYEKHPEKQTEVETEIKERESISKFLEKL